MSEASDFLRAAQVNVIVHAHRAMRLCVLNAFLASALAIAALAFNPHVWWLAALFGASLAMNGYALLKGRLVLLHADASAVRGWMKPAAYAIGVAGAAELLWALWQLSTQVGAT